jgi:hypothetical protein
VFTTGGGEMTRLFLQELLPIESALVSYIRTIRRNLILHSADGCIGVVAQHKCFGGLVHVDTQFRAELLLRIGKLLVLELPMAQHLKPRLLVSMLTRTVRVDLLGGVRALATFVKVLLLIILRLLTVILIAGVLALVELHWPI